MNAFFQDVYKGLLAPLKHLQSKYFYDQEGDRLFEEIMQCPEYYLTRCELEILSRQSDGIIDHIADTGFDVVELGAGNALKSSFFLKKLLGRNISFTYYPIDISGNVINLLEKELPVAMPGLQLHALHGEYLGMLKKAGELSAKKKVVLFLGSNIGNFSLEEAGRFCRQVRDHLSPGDLILTGFDLAKNPKIILAAYNDAAGVTRQFNYNLLRRINREMDADFNTEQFDHFPTYDPATGTCKSYLVSLKDQVVRIGEADFIRFGEGEPVLTEVSQKYTVAQIAQLARACGCTLLHNFYDSHKWFTDSLWVCE